MHTHTVNSRYNVFLVIMFFLSSLFDIYISLYLGLLIRISKNAITRKTWYREFTVSRVYCIESLLY